MLIPSGLLQFCADKTREVTLHYTDSCPWPHESFRSVDDLDWIVAGRYGKYVRTRKLSVQSAGSKIHAMCLHKPDEFEIYLLSGLDAYLERYAKCKEIFQFILDQETLRTTDIIDLVKNMILRTAPESADLDLGHATTSETIAEIAAMEFLFPYSARVEHKAKINGRDGYLRLATDYQAPQFLIERYLSDGMMGALKKYFL